MFDSGFSFGPNPPVVNRQTFGPLQPGDYLMDVSVDIDVMPRPPGYPYVLATGVPFTVLAADAVPNAAPALSEYGKLLMTAFLAFAALFALRSRLIRGAIGRHPR